MITLWKPTRVNNALTSIGLPEMENETGSQMPSNTLKTVYIHSDVLHILYDAYTVKLVVYINNGVPM